MKTLADLDGTRWAGRSELWLDPLGNQGVESACTLEVEGPSVRYTWSYEGQEKQGWIVLEPGATFLDTFHSPMPMECHAVTSDWGIFQVEGRYGDEGEWGWRIGLFFRTTTQQLVLLMTNIAPWGEEARAVRMVLDRVER
jgi:hypothetical protein